MYQKKSKFYIYILVGVIAFVAGWQFNSMGLFGDAVETDDVIVEKEDVEFVVDDDGKADLSLFWLVWQELENKYVDEEALDYEAMVYGAIKGMVSSLGDPYTVFMTPEESEQFSASLEGTLEGIGAELTVEDQNLVIVSPLRNSPAEGAGLMPGDIIYKIEGELAADLSLFEAIMSIRGEKGTAVVLTITSSVSTASPNKPIELNCQPATKAITPTSI